MWLLCCGSCACGVDCIGFNRCFCKTNIELFKVKAPLNKGSIIGKFELVLDKDKYVYDLVIHEDVKKANIFDIFSLIIKNLISGSE